LIDKLSRRSNENSMKMVKESELLKRERWDLDFEKEKMREMAVSVLNKKEKTYK